LNGQLYINTATTPQSLYFKQTGAWTQLTGSNLVDLVNNQTIGGVKTFTTLDAVGAFFGVWLGGKIFALTGSYLPIWWGSVVLALIASLLHLPIRERLWVARLKMES
jgi:hypothetical protein